jgi:L-lactate dehydrogenase
MFVEALTNALGGHGRATGETRWGASVFLQLINPESFGGSDAFQRETSFFSQVCVETPVPAGKPPVRLPGHAGLLRHADQLAHGVQLHPTILPALAPWAEILKVTLPSGV